jgi:threonine synthase
MHHFGLVAGLPKMVLAQAAGCAPIVEAFRCGGDAVRPWPSPRTMASGIKDPLVGYSEDGTYALKVVRRSGGAAVAVSDEDPRHASDGERRLHAEPTAGTATACAADPHAWHDGPDDEGGVH